MKSTEAPDIERRLKSSRLRPPSPELREKVLARALQYRRETAWTTPLLRWCLAGCAAVLLTVSVTDALVSRVQRVRLIALAGGTRSAPTRPDEDMALIAAVLGDPLAVKLAARAERPPSRKSDMRPSRDDYRELERLTED